MGANTGKVFLVEGKRTPFGKFGGSLASVTPVDLAVAAGKKVLEVTNVSADKVDHVILGNVVPASTDTMYGGRHLALKMGCPIPTPGYTLNRLCGSGIQAIADAARLIKLGEANCVIAGGTENMSMIPHLVYGSRFGTKYGALKTVDMLLDALTDQYAGTPMGTTAENLANQYKLTREECDQFSYESHVKAAKAYENNYLQKEIAPIELKKLSCDRDEHIRFDVSLADMNKLRPTFAKEGVVTAGSASGIVDGASVTMIASEEFCNQNGVNPIAEILDYSVVGVDPNIMGIGPAPVIRQLLERNGKSLGDIDLVEVNEAFAPQALAVAKELELDMSKLNIWGGAIAIGHPLAASGSRITTTLANQLRETNGDLGIASACIGGGQGIGILIKKN